MCEAFDGVSYSADLRAFWDAFGAFQGRVVSGMEKTFALGQVRAEMLQHGMSMEPSRWDQIARQHGWLQAQDGNGRLVTLPLLCRRLYYEFRRVFRAYDQASISTNKVCELCRDLLVSLRSQQCVCETRNGVLSQGPVMLLQRFGLIRLSALPSALGNNTMWTIEASSTSPAFVEPKMHICRPHRESIPAPSAKAA